MGKQKDPAQALEEFLRFLDELWAEIEAGGLSMREILFRAKRIDNGEWAEGLPQKMWGEWHIINTEDENTVYPIDPETICQYIGLTDKNGKKIWENDIVTGYFNHKPISGHIKYGSNAVYFIERKGLYGIHLDNSEDWLEVVGNIFDNPELLEED